MIVQSAPPGQPRFVILQSDHARAAGQLAEAFGNEHFEPLYPRELMVYLTAHHDEGWLEVDARLLFDERSGLPYHLGDTPLAALLTTNAASPDFNERHHPLCGILSSMHTCGFYNGRYGLGEAKDLEVLPVEERSAIEAMLAKERRRQERLKEKLASPPEADRVTETHLLYNYLRLQFFDLLALHFHLTPEAARSPRLFARVPRNIHQDATISLERVGKSRYRLTPYPFAEEPLEIRTRGRYLLPQASREELVKHYELSEPSHETVLLTA